jgi:hypothetical protein
MMSPSNSSGLSPPHPVEFREKEEGKADKMGIDVLDVVDG